MKRVTSRDNTDYRRLLRLAESPAERRDSGLLVLDGVHLVEAYMAAYGGAQVELFARESAVDKPEIQGLMERAQGSKTLLADRLLDTAAPVEHPTGIVAVAPVPRSEALHEGGLGEGGLLVLVDGVQDPGNLGSVLRSAAAAGAGAAWISEGSADAWSPKCLRGGMGAQFRLPVRTRIDLPAATRDIRRKVIAMDSAGGDSVYEADLSGSVAIAIGAEGRGISAGVLARADARVRIPMEPGMESLNAAAAAAVVFFEWRRRGRKT
jgi:RNA methyltransferase, TrmH family